MLTRPAALTALALLAFVPLALAHEGATGVVKERMDLMDTQKDAMKVIGEMAKGKVPFDAAKAAEAAGEIERTSKQIPELLSGRDRRAPERGKARSLDQMARVHRRCARAGDGGQGPDPRARGPWAPDWKAQFKGVIDACKTCHKTFRMEEKD
ncbi:cytochrome c [Methyloceanibacter marginalis]|nr:cytochrome c [Methyloceanibacter marginalis]